MKTIVYTLRAATELDSLSLHIKNKIEEAIILYALTGRGDVKKLTGFDAFRLRVGQYRVIFDEDGMTILAIQIGRRNTHTYSRM